MSGFLENKNLSSIVTDGRRHLLLVRRRTTAFILVRGIIWRGISLLEQFPSRTFYIEIDFPERDAPFGVSGLSVLPRKFLLVILNLDLILEG